MRVLWGLNMALIARPIQTGRMDRDLSGSRGTNMQEHARTRSRENLPCSPHAHIVNVLLWKSMANIMALLDKHSTTEKQFLYLLNDWL